MRLHYMSRGELIVDERMFSALVRSLKAMEAS